MKMQVGKLSVLLIILSFIACKKQESFGALTDLKPAIPVTVANVYENLNSASVKASKAENKIVITLQIPAESGRTIKEITKVAAATTGSYSAIYSSTTVSSSGLYSNTPISGSGTSVTFTTTFDEYRSKTGGTANTVYTSNALLARDFYFLLTLDNGETIIPQFVRVWVVD